MRHQAVVLLVVLAACAEASLHRMVRAPKGNVNLPASDSKYWNALTPSERAGALALGYTEQMWNSNGFPPSDDKRWNTLSPAEQKGALALGYGQKLWDHELDGRATLPPGGKTVKDAVAAADKIMNAIDDHLTQHRAKQDPSSPEAHDANMQAEIDGHNDSPQAHDARMEAEMEAHGKKTDAPDAAAKQQTIDAMRGAAVDAAAADPEDAAPFHGQIAHMHPEIVQIWKKAKALFANIPESSASFARGKDLFAQIKGAVEASIKKAVAANKVYTNGAKDPASTNSQLDQWLNKGNKMNEEVPQGGVPNHYVPHKASTGSLSVTVKKMPISPPIVQPNGTPLPMEQVNKQLEAPAKESRSAGGSIAHLSAEAPGKSSGNTRHPNPNVPKAEREASRAHLENAAASLQQDSQGLVRKISQFDDDRQGLVNGNKQMISKINGFFSDNSQNAGAANHPNDAVRQAAEQRVVAKTDAKVAAHEASPGIESEAPASQISDGEHVPGDTTMNQGEQPPTAP